MDKLEIEFAFPETLSRDPGDYVVLKVKDYCIGITSKDLDKIFEPSYTKKVMRRSGTGLGMAVVFSTQQNFYPPAGISIKGKNAGQSFFRQYQPQIPQDSNF